MDEAGVEPPETLTTDATDATGHAGATVGTDNTGDTHATSEADETQAAAEAPDDLVPTPSQTAGPFLSIGTSWLAGTTASTPPATGLVTVSGHVFDGAGTPVTDAVLEFWQADAEGRYPPDTEAGWTGFARAFTDHEGGYRLSTVLPAGVPAGDGRPQAPHIDVSIFARGLMQRLVTRIYFSDSEAANAVDPVLASLPDPATASRMIAQAGPEGYELDLRLQGAEESVFFVP
jgi:protocatechuate 3,4-dioxygenase alpha subunit